MDEKPNTSIYEYTTQTVFNPRMGIDYTGAVIGSMQKSGWVLIQENSTNLTESDSDYGADQLNVLVFRREWKED